MHLPLPLIFSLSTLLVVPTARADPFTWIRDLSGSVADHRGWLWGWVWGADSSVSVVDRFPPVTFLSRPAAFGAEVIDPLLGYVIPLSAFTAPCPDDARDDRDAYRADIPLDTLSPNIGCPRLCVVGSHEPEPTETWIALVQRGQCQFADKAREAQRLGAKAVVVGGDDPEVSGNADVLVNMYSPGAPLPRVSPFFFLMINDTCVLIYFVPRRRCVGRINRGLVHSLFRLYATRFSHRIVKHLAFGPEDRVAAHQL